MIQEQLLNLDITIIQKKKFEIYPVSTKLNRPGHVGDRNCIERVNIAYPGKQSTISFVKCEKTPIPASSNRTCDELLEIKTTNVVAGILVNDEKESTVLVKAEGPNTIEKTEAKEDDVIEQGSASFCASPILRTQNDSLRCPLCNVTFPELEIEKLEQHVNACLNDSNNHPCNSAHVSLQPMKKQKTIKSFFC